MTEGFTIDMTIPGMRRRVAMAVMQSRLKMAIRFKRTDSDALASARGWAAKDGIKVPFHTMKQALRWVDAEMEKYKAADAEADKQ